MLKEKARKDASEQVAVVTGSSKGIGKAIAIEFAKEGYKVVLNGRDENAVSEAANNIKNTIGANEERITYLAGDVSHEDICSSLIEHTVKTFGGIDVLVNNAGIGGAQKNVQELTADEWDYVVDVNLKGAFLCTREAIKRMTHEGKSVTKTSQLSISP
jgi:NAD(P)-dependent dehydrogenase (short-subunit alcohol dehydrogenase family)